MALDPNTKYLRQVTTGRIFGWCEAFAARSDMVPYRAGDEPGDVTEITVDMRKDKILPGKIGPEPSDIEDVVPLETVTETPDPFNQTGMGALFSGGESAPAAVKKTTKK